MIININSNAVVAHTNRLEKLHKSALPNAIRATLNDAAFDVKKVTMPDITKKTFTNRSPNFFKANSRVEMAKGWNIEGMKSTVGFVSQALKGARNYAVKDLEQQEEGGVIDKKSFIPTNKARSGNSPTKVVRANARLSSIKNAVNRKNSKGANWAQQMIKSAVHVGVGGKVLTDRLSKFKGGALFGITSIKRVKGNIRFKATKIYSFTKNRKIVVKSSGFMRACSLDSASKMGSMFIINAEKQIARLTK